MIKEVTTDAEVSATFPVTRQLRPHLKEEEYLEVVHRLRRSGYRLAFAAESGEVRCAAEFRVIEFLAYKVSLCGRPRDRRRRPFGRLW